MKLLRFILACCFLAVITLGQAPIQRQPFTTNVNGSAVTWGGTGSLAIGTTNVVGEFSTKATSVLHITQALHGFVAGDVLYVDGTGTYIKAQADDEATSWPVGVVESVASVNEFTLVTGGMITLVGLTPGQLLLLSAGVAGGLTTSVPGEGEYYVPVMRTIDGTTGMVEIGDSVLVETIDTYELYTIANLTNTVDPVEIRLPNSLSSNLELENGGVYVSLLREEIGTNQWIKTGNSTLSYYDTNIIRSTRGAGYTYTGVVASNVLTAGCTYVQTYWVRANDAQYLAQAAGARTNIVWLTDTNITTDWALYAVRCKATGNHVLIQSYCDSSTDWIEISNVVIYPYPAYPDGYRGFSSSINDDYTYGQVQSTPTIVNNPLTGAEYRIIPSADIISLEPNVSLTLTEIPTITPGSSLGQKITLLCTNELGYTITLQSTNVLAGSGLKLMGPTRTLTSNVVSTLVWDGFNWIEISTSDTNNMYFASVTVGGTNLVSAIGDISSTTNNWVLKTGDTMTGNLWVNADLYVTNSTVTSYFHLTPTNWVDSMVPGMSFRNGASAPSLENGPSADIKLLSFAKDADNLAHGTLQLNHNYKEGTDIEPHIHLYYPTYAAAGADTNVWQITYSWGNIATNGFVGTPTTVIVTNDGVIYAGEHRVIPFSTISGSGKTISSVLMITVERTGTDGYDVYDDYIGFLGFDVHYQADTIGSSSEWGK